MNIIYFSNKDAVFFCWRQIQLSKFHLEDFGVDM